MNTKKTSVFQNALIWFGAGVSIAEILTGTYFAPLGMARGLAAILVGHIIGCVMLFLAGYIGAKSGRTAMETVKMSFGQKGSMLFSALNVLQLVGWTAIMIYDGALAANGVLATGAWLWCVVIGVLIVVWILIGITDLGLINKIVMTALCLLLGLVWLLFRKVISWHIPVSYIATVAVLTLIFPRGGADAVQWMLYNLFGGGLMLGAIFMATDYSTSPITKKGQLIYGIGCGLFTVFIRYFGSYPEGVCYSILVMNCVAPLIDKCTKPARFGVAKSEKKEASAK